MLENMSGYRQGCSTQANAIPASGASTVTNPPQASEVYMASTWPRYTTHMRTEQKTSTQPQEQRAAHHDFFLFESGVSSSSEESAGLAALAPFAGAFVRDDRGASSSSEESAGAGESFLAFAAAFTAGFVAGFAAGLVAAFDFVAPLVFGFLDAGAKASSSSLESRCLSLGGGFLAFAAGFLPLAGCTFFLGSSAKSLSLALCFAGIDFPFPFRSSLLCRSASSRSNSPCCSSHLIAISDSGRCECSVV
mmetsp:Transcript_22176/g.47918  ORF Transcript_22176/g.47918 Transcript_22176/m.47918 type:complete len:249 (-) Transcript_22176:157-903(-)|eukprot:CAMPEP_0183346258 /NCGR_PEP_ID=MMETSP0164_2-20130417/11433_1 /TAXON_ID=221442 /ORGANISM="Coccolithus pelagicus ssp braarudi, Strain PLY182g" /LENGTH=248 /DNA_ID=CAMNT_0025517507 /DNA_START=237 /DNA_END=983 /DNA_ORIENTATION=-